ncbi:MAG: AAA family ATPase [Flavobacteriaceae bacterium]|nr:AAA family ATPase [Flavobacteriaceae bacterium]
MIGKQSEDLYRAVEGSFEHELTTDQKDTLRQLSNFIFNQKKEELFLLKGYAGTGKTTLIGALVTKLWTVGKKSVLLAPTGRAAKVMSSFSNSKAYTIHKKIYFPKKQSNGGVSFTLGVNKHKDTIFIVDEASMISDRSLEANLFENDSLLADLIQYVYSGHRCKLMFVGDVAQLPPVKLNISPALDPSVLEIDYQKDVILSELSEVVRQTKQSGILVNATQIRSQLEQELYGDFRFQIDGYSDIVRLIEGNEIQEAIEDAYREVGKEETAFIVRSNKRANLYNESIRSRILYLEHDLAVGDFMMVVKNNYFWLPTTSTVGFIANGDLIEVLEIRAIKELYGFKFAEVTVQMVDYPNQKPFDTILMLDTISSESPSLSYEDSNRLYQEVLKDYENEKSKYKKYLGVKNNEYFNALQVKFSYAITCHKSQGGQWKRIFIEQPYLPDGVDKEYLRWLYTAITRAQDRLYLIGFKNEFFL